ncbi:unnamed protein product [Darwinula stevensoni]|uniref:Uncharacterized protein n=1 Tax=Darwinula stevensoni TaxID=69355 RepID=A0A7R9A009_9CRUS|nr:unnamed protein product [Darwinula stevensoni]CAG0884613.1 unnamed protein product [Darwinula stevensoni]
MSMRYRRTIPRYVWLGCLALLAMMYMLFRSGSSKSYVKSMSSKFTDVPVSVNDTHSMFRDHCPAVKPAITDIETVRQMQEFVYDIFLIAKL